MPRETKAQREAREAKERLEAQHATEPANEGETEPTPLKAVPDSEDAPEPNVIHVLVERDEAGNVEVDVGAAGDIRVTEISDLLILGLKKWRIKSGLTLD